MTTVDCLEDIRLLLNWEYNILEERHLWDLRLHLAESLSIIHCTVVDEYDAIIILPRSGVNGSLLQEALAVSIALETNVHKFFVFSQVTEQEAIVINDVFCELPEYIWGIGDILSMVL